MTTTSGEPTHRITTTIQSNLCNSRRLILTVVCFIIYLHYDKSVIRVISFSLNAPSLSVHYCQSHANQRFSSGPGLQPSLLNPTSCTYHRGSSNYKSPLNAIALPPNAGTVRTSDSKSIDTNWNGYMSSDSTKPQQQKQPNVGVLLLNLGGPETGDDVEGRNKIIGLLLLSYFFDVMIYTSCFS